MNTITNYILDMLNDDIVSHGFLVQCIEQDEGWADGSQLNWKSVLNELISGEVEIGKAKTTSADYVEFIAWIGSASERISRAAECVNNSVGYDQEFAYWLCLRKNVDRYEEEYGRSG